LFPARPACSVFGPPTALLPLGAFGIPWDGAPPSRIPFLYLRLPRHSPPPPTSLARFAFAERFHHANPSVVTPFCTSSFPVTSRFVFFALYLCPGTLPSSPFLRSADFSFSFFWRSKTFLFFFFTFCCQKKFLMRPLSYYNLGSFFCVSSSVEFLPTFDALGERACQLSPFWFFLRHVFF